MRITTKRVITTFVVVSGLVTGYQILSKPQPVAVSQTAEEARANSQAFDQKIEALETARNPDSPPAEVHFTSDEVSAEVVQSMGAGPVTTSPTATKSPASADAVVGEGNVQVKGYQVKLVGDVARGQFITNVAGKDVYVTLAGHLGSQDGYVTFDPTEFKIGEFSVPISLVNSALQKKLVEQREQLKLPEGVAGLRIENGELVILEK
jgi:hypothetical protein